MLKNLPVSEDQLRQICVGYMEIATVKKLENFCTNPCICRTVFYKDTIIWDDNINVCAN